MTTTGPLAFVGGGEWRPGCEFDRLLADAVDAEQVVVLPTAAAYEHPDRVVDNARTWFAGLGLDVAEAPVLTRADAENPVHADLVRKARFIYLSDGSPLHLRSVLKDSAVWAAIVEAWHSGAAVAGSSAGATVLADPMVDPRGGTFTLGLGMIRNFAAVPQWERLTGTRARRMSHLTPKGAVLAEIEESTAIVRSSGGKWQVHGDGKTIVKVDNQVIALDQVEDHIETVSVL